MDMRFAWRSLIMLGCVGVLGACSSAEDKSDPKMGSAGAAAGRQGSAGASGSSAVSGRTGGQLDGGTGANSQDCPGQAPLEDSVCSAVGLSCSYPGMDCACEAGRADDNVSPGWNCRRAALMCPATLPANGDACTPGRGECMFGASICNCSEDTQTWACWDPADCPASLPDERSPCDLVTMECEYATEQGNEDCECTAQGWDCDRQVCPDAAPTPGGACEGGDGTCAFSGQVCDCRRRMWLCWDPADCPAAPAHDSACPLEDMICEYTGGECECEDGLWNCDDELIVGGDADAGI